MRTALFFTLAVGVLVAPVAALAQSAGTTRIETRPFYGATVTLEEGVRVFRPLPQTERVIMNPGGATPLSLSFEEKRSVSHNYNHGPANSYAASPDGGSYGYAPVGRDRRKYYGHRPAASGLFGGGKVHRGRH